MVVGGAVGGGAGAGVGDGGGLAAGGGIPGADGAGGEVTGAAGGEVIGETETAPGAATAADDGDAYVDPVDPVRCPVGGAIGRPYWSTYTVWWRTTVLTFGLRWCARPAPDAPVTRTRGGAVATTAVPAAGARAAKAAINEKNADVLSPAARIRPAAAGCARRRLRSGRRATIRSCATGSGGRATGAAVAAASADSARGRAVGFPSDPDDAARRAASRARRSSRSGFSEDMFMRLRLSCGDGRQSSWQFHTPLSSSCGL